MDSEDFDDNLHQRGEGTPHIHDKSSMSKGSNAYLNQSRRCCNCKQSRCIKLYCECFAAGVYCNNTCNCVDCWNNPKFEDHRKAAIKSTLEKNPGAFQPKISNQSIIEAKLAEHGKHSKGCACKKSSCMKKYCECFQAQIPCSDLCKCIDCHNTKEYYDANKNPSIASDIGKPEDLADSNSFFFKFLLAAGEPDSPGKSMKIPALNKRLNSSLSQEALERLYERLMKIINLPLDEFLDNEEYVKEIKTYNEESIRMPTKKENKGQQESKSRESQSQTIDKESEAEKMKTENDKEEAKEGLEEHDDLICDEDVEELVLKPGGPQETENKAQAGKEKHMEVEYDKDDKNADTDENAEKERKLSLYKIKKTRIIREFIAVLRELDT